MPIAAGIASSSASMLARLQGKRLEPERASGDSDPGPRSTRPAPRAQWPSLAVCL
jgi:hypothetical protein